MTMNDRNTMKLQGCLHLCAGLVLALFLATGRSAEPEPSLPPLRAQ